MSSIQDFVRISQYSGMREDLIQASGGNTSLKLDNGQMLIKASGVQLADITAEEGYSTIETGVIVAYLEALLENKTACDEKEILNKALLAGKRPSIETFLHSCTDVLTLHTHSVAVNILAARKGGMEVLRELFPNALVVDYATPGLALAEAFYRAYKDGMRAGAKPYKLIFLKNHGLIVTGKTADEVIQLTEDVTLKLEKYLGWDASPYHDLTKLHELWLRFEPTSNEIIYKVEAKGIIDYYKANGYCMWQYQFCPDCLVFCGRQAMELADPMNVETVKSFIQVYGNLVILSYKNNLYIKTSSVKKAKEIESVLAFSATVAKMNQGYEMDGLSEKEQNFLLNWDAEKYRQQMK